MLRALYCYFFHLCLVTIITICSIEATAQQLTKTTYGVNSALGTNTIFDIHFSSDNLLYIATDNGFWSYNGLDFFEYKHSLNYSSNVHSIQENTAGEIFIADFYGNVFKLQQDSLVLYDVPIKEKINHFIIQEKYTYYLTNKNIFAQSNQTKEIHPIRLPEDLLDIAMFSDYGYFYGRRKHKRDFWGWVQDTSLMIKEEGYNQKRFCNDYDKHFYNFSPDGQSILSNSKDTLCHLKEAPRNLTVYKLKQVNEQVFLACKEGLYLPKTAQLFFEGNFVNEVISDNEHNIWVCTLNKGLHKVTNLNNIYFPVPSPNTEVGFAFVDQRHMIYSDKLGKLFAWNFQDKTFKLFYETTIRGNVKSIFYDSLKQHYVSSGNQIDVFDRSLNIIASKSSRGGVYPIENNLYSQKKRAGLFFPFSVDLYLKHEISPDPQLLYQTKAYAFRERSIKEQSLLDFTVKLDKSIKGFRLLDDKMIIAHEDSLLFVSINDFQVKKKIVLPNLRKLYRRNHRVFVVSSDKIIEVDAEGHFLLEKSRLPHLKNRINQIAVDDQHICVQTRNDIYLFDAKTFDYIHKFSTQNGITSSDFDNIWLYEGDLYTNGYKGISKIVLDGNYNKGKVLLKIAKVLVQGKEQSNTTFNHDQNDIEFVLSIRSYSSSGTLKWRINDKAWNETSNNVQNIRLNELQAGNYTVEAYFENDFGVVSETVHYTFNITPPYWKRWWFYGLIYLSGMAVFVGIFWQHNNNKRKEEQLKNQNNILRMQALQTQMNPHFIFNIQAAIQGLWLRGEEKGALSLQNKFSKLLRKIFQYSGQLSISIDQLVEFLENYIAMERIRFQNNIEINFHVDPSLMMGDFFVPPLLVQPIVENSFKHGLLHREKDRILSIQIINQDPYLYCVIEDNGVGRQTNLDHLSTTQKKASGLETTKNRLRLLQENIIKQAHPQNNMRITDLKDASNQAIGTKVELWIPFVDFQEQ